MLKLLYQPVSPAASVMGGVLAGVRAAVSRGAEGTRKITGIWPGEKAAPEGPRE
jgi:hypothetical protein